MNFIKLFMFWSSFVCLDSLEPFAYDISHSVDVPTILPLLIQHGLITRHDNDYFIHHSYTNAEKQSKLTCLVVSLNEDYVDKFLDCLSQTSNFAPHDTLWNKIQSGMSPAAHCYTHS